MINQVIHGDCLKIMKDIPDNSIDLVVTDPPYGTTSNEWDNIVNFWQEFKRICKTGFVIFSSQPYTTDLISSNKKDFKYCWIWNKEMTGNFVIAKHQPLKIHEEICIFGNIKYNPIMRKGKLRFKGGSNKVNTSTGNIISKRKLSDDYFPVSILNFNNSGFRITSSHPTQKPVDLIAYLIKTYSNENDLILDPFLGSGTTAVAAQNLKRNWIGIEISKEYCEIARQRLRQKTLL